MSARPLAPGLCGDGISRDRHPPWFSPVTNPSTPSLQLLNSLTETVEPFYPMNKRLVKWYTCGPTVYDSAHMGHARAYLTFDIVRRIMEDYFSYSVLYQMNITDIDDKIIQRARVTKLLSDRIEELEREKASDPAGALKKTQVLANDSVKHLAHSLHERRIKLEKPLDEAAAKNPRAKSEREEKMKELELKEQQLKKIQDEVAAAIATGSVDAIMTAARGVIGDYLDHHEGHRIEDQEIFEKHARYYEKSFFHDLRRLGVRDPDVVTRVTEYVPQVIDYIAKIEKNGFAYRGKTSVFFDTEAYKKAGHPYPKLKPGSANTAAADATEDEMAEGEGGLSKAEANEKRHPNDFALWKFSKPGEPRWPSPWGLGRPGWHIECSVMATDVLGTNFDIHSGGADLKFPHHDNECAQSEAFSQEHQWVNYFLHCGHLHIQGLKMSKSLKNFITIDQALGELGVTPRMMRLLFLSNNWQKAMNFSDQSLDEAREKERVLRAFFGSVEATLRQPDPWGQVQGASDADRVLLQQLNEAEEAVHEALLNNLDTPLALQHLMTLVSAANAYLTQCNASNGEQRVSRTVLQKVARYLTKMFKVFGVIEGTDSIGWQQGAGEDSTEPFNAVMDALVAFRDNVKNAARETGTVKSFMPLCDDLRDEQLSKVGVRLEDAPSGRATWKRDDPEALQREKEQREAQAATERFNKAVNQAATKEKQIKKWEQYHIDPNQYLSARENEKPEAERRYKPFTGTLPSHLLSGEAVDDKEVKKLTKELSKYTTTYQQFQDKGGDKWLSEEREALKELEKIIAQGH